MPLEDKAPPDAGGRLLSIDALRGFDMFWIIGGDTLGRAIGKWSDSDAGRVVVEQLEHVEWEGFHFYDLIFPLFLFLVGCVLPFSLDKYRGAAGEGGSWGAAAYRRIARRTALLFLLGLIANGLLQLDWGHLRVAGVLQRIALCYGTAALITMNASSRAVAFTLAAILLGYWAVLANLAPPGGTAGDYSMQGNLAGWVDRHYLPGEIKKAYYGFGDNEGLLSTIPAVGTTLLGVLAGRWLRSGRGPWSKAGALAVAGAVSVALGFLWGQSFPVIKILWTSSFVLVAGGFSLLLLAAFYTVLDVLKVRAWAFFFTVIGANAITIYVAPRFLDFAYTARSLFGGLYRLAEDYGSPDLRVIATAVGVLAVKWLFLLFLYRKRIFLRV